MTHTPAPTTTNTRPANAITCSCGAWWTGLTRAHCPACHATFSCDSAADKHRIGKHGIDRRCTNPADVGLVPVTRPWGDMWQHPQLDTLPWRTA